MPVFKVESLRLRGRVWSRGYCVGLMEWGTRKEPNMNFVFNRLSEWEYQPMPSSRTEDFYKRCRYETVDEAVANLEKYGL